MTLPNEDASRPTCGVVIQKKDGELEELICPEVATQLTSIVDPVDQAKVIAVVLTCERHDHELEEGKTLIFKSEDEIRIAVQYTKPTEVPHVS